MDREQIKHYLHTELEIPKENLKDGMWTNEVYIEYIVPQLDPESPSRYLLRTLIEYTDGKLEVSPDASTNMKDTKYPHTSGHFKRRIRIINEKMVAKVKEAQTVQDNYVYERDLFKSKYHDLLCKYGSHLSIPASVPIIARLQWFGSSYIVDLDSEEVRLGYGDKARVVPLTAALDFLNECEVYKLLQE